MIGTLYPDDLGCLRPVEVVVHVYGFKMQNPNPMLQVKTTLTRLAHFGPTIGFPKSAQTGLLLTQLV